MDSPIPNQAATNADAAPDGRWPWLQTYTGKAFFPSAPRAEDINIVDIAVGLSRESRFNGQTKEPYSVAQHSILVSRIVPPEHALWGLLHDASEAYAKDLTYSIKSLLPEYKAVEHSILRVIIEKYGLTWPEPACVKEADLIVLATEKRDLLGPPPRLGRDLPAPLLKTLVPYSGPRWACRQFLMRFTELTGGSSFFRWPE
jgi:hypothetical protein